MAPNKCLPSLLSSSLLLLLPTPFIPLRSPDGDVSPDAVAAVVPAELRTVADSGDGAAPERARGRGPSGIITAALPPPLLALSGDGGAVGAKADRDSERGRRGDGKACADLAVVG